MKEIGGYFELEKNSGREYHNNAIALNCGRHCLSYLIKVYNIKKIYLPLFCCNSIRAFKILFPEVQMYFYNITPDFLPVIPEEYHEEDWFYLVNFYGQISKSVIKKTHKKIHNLIIDNAHNFFEKPIGDLPTIYTCRKYFGVSDGGYLYSEKKLAAELVCDYSYNRMNFVLGRFEKKASDFYEEASCNNDIFDSEPMKQMSKITKNLMCGIDYKKCKRIREHNFNYLNSKLKNINKFKNMKTGTYMYPLYLSNGAEIRKKLQKNKIYIPTLWPDVFDNCPENSLEFDYAKNILPLPIDQRYNQTDMDVIINCIKENL